MDSKIKPVINAVKTGSNTSNVTPLDLSKQVRKASSQLATQSGHSVVVNLRPANSSGAQANNNNLAPIRSFADAADLARRLTDEVSEEEHGFITSEYVKDLLE